jgi:hypothetical protein
LVWRLLVFSWLAVTPLPFLKKNYENTKFTLTKYTDGTVSLIVETQNQNRPVRTLRRQCVKSFAGNLGVQGVVASMIVENVNWSKNNTLIVRTSTAEPTPLTPKCSK